MYICSGIKYSDQIFGNSNRIKIGKEIYHHKNMNLYIISTLFSGEHLIVILAAVVFLFGGKKIPEFMGGIGKGMKEFKKAMKEDENPSEVKKEEPKEISAVEVKPAGSELNA